MEAISKILTKFPFLESFPFYNVYDLNIITREYPPATTEVSAVTYEPEIQENLTFCYAEDSNAIHAFFYDEDIKFLEQKSVEIKKLDSVNQKLEEGLATEDVDKKIKYLKTAYRFMNKVDPEYFDLESFGEDILNDLVGKERLPVAAELIHKLRKKLDGKKVVLNEEENRLAISFFNFQLNYAKIVLGIVIAAKIH